MHQNGLKKIDEPEYDIQIKDCLHIKNASFIAHAQDT